MSVTHLKKWDVTAIEIALDLEIARLIDPSRAVFSGPAEPRICLVSGFAVTSQLKRIIAAVDRAAPPRPPSGLRLVPVAVRSPARPTAPAIAVQPMLSLLRLQSKLIRAIEPGLAHDTVSSRTTRDMDESAATFVDDFISRKMLPTFEPPSTAAELDGTPLRATGITIYRLGRRGAPESILAHWPYPKDPGSVHLLGGP
jgi:hypothetical protein